MNLIRPGMRLAHVTTTSSGEVCRILLNGPHSRVELSVPVHVPLADLIPALMRSLGPDLGDEGLDHSGWILQHLGEEPLDEDATVSDLGLLDGEVLYLRPRSEQLPPLDFDDLIDGIANGLRTRPGLWTPQTTRVVSLATSVAFLTLAAGLACRGPITPVRALIVLATALTLLIGSAGACVARDQVLSRCLGVPGIGFAFLGGVFAAGAISRSPGLDAVMLQVGLMAGALAAFLVAPALVETADVLPLVAGVLATAVMALAAGVLDTVTGLDSAALAAVVAVVAVVARSAVPVSAFKLARLRLPDLPADATDLKHDIDPVPGRDLMARAAVADAFMTALYAADGSVTGAALLVLALSPGSTAPTTAVLLAVSQLLAVRVMTSARHRLALGLPAVTAVAVVIASLSGRGPAGTVVGLAIALILAVAAAVSAHVLPQRRLTPLWGRTGDWAHVATLTAAGPLVLGALGAFDLVRRTVA